MSESPAEGVPTAEELVAELRKAKVSDLLVHTCSLLASLAYGKLDPSVRDVHGVPAPRVTYQPHRYELETRRFYIQWMKQILANAGAERIFTAPCETLLGDPPTSRHVMGTLRMGADPAVSVVAPDGRFHDVDNLYACDGSVFPTSGGWNPTLTIFANALRVAHGLAGTAP